VNNNSGGYVVKCGSRPLYVWVDVYTCTRQFGLGFYAHYTKRVFL